jgi:CMP-N-acetylneuraminic acid synthetase
MRRIAIIPAREGSKRIPKKNIIDFCGKPMVAWTIEAALRTNLFDQVLVSTDSQEIAQVAEAFGAVVPFLRKENFDDFVPVSDATISALKQSEDYWKVEYEVVVQLMANCPLRTESHILDAMSAFESGGVGCQVSCFRFGWMNPWWAATLDEDSFPQPLFPEAMVKRSQDQPSLFSPTGAIWIANRTALLSSMSFYGPKHRYHPMDWHAAIDIDNYEDLKMARVLAAMTD